MSDEHPAGPGKYKITMNHPVTGALLVQREYEADSEGDAIEEFINHCLMSGVPGEDIQAEVEAVS